ncbi:MAG: YfcE family phosphodiesterase [Desulfobulbus sp.]|jgi:putative phosphoesterase
MVLRAGVLSDTHLIRADDRFIHRVRHCFSDCPVIIHAGDLTSAAVLDAFHDKTLYAVHGNMCDQSVRQRHPRQRVFPFGAFTIGLTHGAGLGADIEEALWGLFPEADCMIYGHTHKPVCRRIGHTLVLNPGSFRETGPYGAPGSYAILEAGHQLTATLHEVPRIP